MWIHVGLLTILIQPLAFAAETRVHLFGQPCMLSGPPAEDILKAIHSISPEQMPPSPSGDQVRTLLDRMKKIAGIPPALDRYREQLTRRLEAQAAFHDGVAAAKKAGKPEPLLEAVKTFLDPKRATKFTAL